MAQTFENGYALLIGVGKCIDTEVSLPTTVKDMQALREILVNPNLCAYPDNSDHVRLLHDEGATRNAIVDGLDWLATQTNADRNATTIVYYSGHGWLETKSGQYYLVPHDFNKYEWRNTALSADDFQQALRKISSRRLLVILDCCHAAKMATAKGEAPSLSLPPGVVAKGDPEELIDTLKQGKGRVVVTSCRGPENSWIREDHMLSVYTHHLIEALQGAASQPGATEVTVFDMANHLGKVVPKTAEEMGRKQNPKFDMATERFAIALLLGGKGLPKGGWEEIKSQSQTQNQVSIDNSVTQMGDRATNVGSISGGDVQVGDRVYYQSPPKTEESKSE